MFSVEKHWVFSIDVRWVQQERVRCYFKDCKEKFRVNLCCLRLSKAVHDSSTSEEDIPKFARKNSVGNPLEPSAEAIYAVVDKPKPKPRPRLLLPAAVR